MRGNGGIIGSENVPTTDAASGIWGLRQIYNAVSDEIWVTLPAFVATGGTVTDINEGGVDYRVHTFTSSDTFEVSGTQVSSKNIEYLVVAGGGSGSSTSGGGAGGFRTNVPGSTSGGNSSPESSLTLSPGQHTVVVGAGGASIQGPEINGNSGEDSSFASITSIGGGGAGRQISRADASGLDGGSGGGRGTGYLASGTPGSGTAGQGSDGGTSTDYTKYYAGGGGGAGQKGGDGTDVYGGDGLSSSIDGSSKNYAGGGGANAHPTRTDNPRGVGGIGGGGDAALSEANENGEDGGTNTGGGGGAGNRADDSYTSGAGGSGIVIIRYQI